jgi:hypothetical protein
VTITHASFSRLGIPTRMEMGSRARFENSFANSMETLRQRKLIKMPLQIFSEGHASPKLRLGRIPRPAENLINVSFLIDTSVVLHAQISGECP